MATRAMAALHQAGAALVPSFREVSELTRKLMWSTPIAVETYAVDEERWRSIHAATNAAREIAANALGHVVVLECLADTRKVEAQLAGVAEQISIAQAILVFVQQIVHGPELSLKRRSLGHPRRSRGVGMCLGKWKVAEHETQIRTELQLHALDDRTTARRVRELEVAGFDHNHPRLRVAFRMVVLANSRPVRCVCAAHRPAAGNASRDPRIPSPPGFTSMGDTNLPRTMPSPSM